VSASTFRYGSAGIHLYQSTSPDVSQKMMRHRSRA
jgi:hypothetical protein